MAKASVGSSITEYGDIGQPKEAENQANHHIFRQTKQVGGKTKEAHKPSKGKGSARGVDSAAKLNAVGFILHYCTHVEQHATCILIVIESYSLHFSFFSPSYELLRIFRR